MTVMNEMKSSSRWRGGDKQQRKDLGGGMLEVGLLSHVHVFLLTHNKDI